MEYKPFTFADRLKELMAEKDLTRSEIARICGIDKSNITRYCNGKYEAKQDVIYRMAAALGVSESWLMGYDVPMSKAAREIQNELAYQTEEEQALLRCWRQATDEQRENVAFILRDYGMPHPKPRSKGDGGSLSVSAGA